MGALRHPGHEDGGRGSGAAARAWSVPLKRALPSPGEPWVGLRPRAGQGLAARPWAFCGFSLAWKLLMDLS